MERFQISPDSGRILLMDSFTLVTLGMTSLVAWLGVGVDTGDFFRHNSPMTMPYARKGVNC